MKLINNNGADEEKRKIINSLEKSGFPAEIRIAKILNEKDWMIYPGALFEDIESGKQREIDMHAVHVDWSLSKDLIPKNRGNENKLISHLIIETKKSDKPWVFFDNYPINYPHIPSKTLKSEDEDFSYVFSGFSKFPIPKHRYVKAKTHKSFYEALSAPNQGQSIYEALVKTNKALDYFRQRYGTGEYSIHIFIPIIVVDGTLWSATLKKDGSIDINKTESLVTSFSYIDKNSYLNKSFEEEVLVDIVTLNNFEQFLESIQRDNKAIYKIWTKYHINKRNIKKKHKLLPSK